MTRRTTVITVTILSSFVLLVIVLLPGIATETGYASPNGDPELELVALQHWIYEQGYNYTVAENAITRLTPEERAMLCSYHRLEPPTEPLPEHIRFRPAEERGGIELLAESPIEQLPTSYDAMALGYVTPVKNQGGCGSCWVFAAIADLESDVLRDEGLAFDFAEQEVGDCNVWSSLGGYNFCEGGIGLMFTNYFTKQGGAAETCHPYFAVPQTCRECSILRTVDNWRTITESNGESQVYQIKNAILQHGPVFATIYSGGAGFGGYNSGVYEYWGPEQPNHAVEIIGWNDSLPHTHGTGAWLIKNSWGTSWGAHGPYPGCAWVAFGSANLGDDASAFVSYRNATEQLFYHDECGWMGYLLGCGEPTAYGAVRFIPQRAFTLTAVEFWAIDTNMDYEIRIYETVTAHPDYYTFSDQLGTTQTGSTEEWGYYSIPLQRPVPLDAGDDVVIQITFTTGRYGYPIPIDYYTESWLPPWSGVATFSGESYASCDGRNYTKPYNPYSGDYYDVGIRARAELLIQPPTACIDSITPNPAVQILDLITFSGNGTDADGTVVAYNWNSSRDGFLSTAESFAIPASNLSVGTHVISFQVQDDDGAWSSEALVNLTILPFDPSSVFDTGPGGYPSIAGTHSGTLRPNQSMLVSKLYTYPCPGSGGHTAYVRVFGNGVDVNATWDGYHGDWHTISFTEPFILQGGTTYNYELRTGSYPQLIHASSRTVPGGLITCSSFVDANGEAYVDRIPAIMLD
jgi:C1A family cysteine protease